MLSRDTRVLVDAPAQGSLTTVPLTFTGTQLRLNGVGEQMRVALLDGKGHALPGFGFRDCDALTGDHIAGRVTWRGRSDLRELAGKRIRMRFDMRKAKLYAFQFVR